MNVPQLRAALTEFGLDSSGLKPVLQSRLREAIFQNDFSQSEPNTSVTFVQNDLNVSSNSNVINVLSEQSNSWDIIKVKQGPVFKRIPKNSRLQCCLAFTKILNSVISKNDEISWSNLLNFPRCGIGSSKRGGKKKQSQATILNKRLANFMSGNDVTLLSQPSTKKSRNPTTLKSQVSAKMASADIQGAVRILTSKETILPHSVETTNKLKDKHPKASPDSQAHQDPLDEDSCFRTDKESLSKALHSFKKGSGGGPDGLLPQHLLDMCGDALGEPASKLLDTLVTFMNLIVYPGRVPSKIRDTFYGANLIALKKEDDGLRPIAVGFTLRRLAAKIVMFDSREFCKKEFQPNQLGVGTPKGAESAIHALRAYLENPASQDKVVLKIDFKNAFNCIRRDKILSLVKRKIPKIYNFVYQCYSEKSNLFFGPDTMYSEEGVQQGDPMGPFLFSLGIQDLVRNCDSEFNCWYLDDGTLAGDVESVLKDATMITNAISSHGLKVNPSKSEIFLVNPISDLCKKAPESFNRIMQGIKVLPKSELKLLGAPVYVDSVENVLGEKIENLELMVKRLEQIDPHEALFLLRHCFGMPKLTYFLRTAPCFMKPDVLTKIDSIIRVSLTSILNITLPERSYTQATLPIAYGGLGIRLSTDIALAGFLSSVCATTSMVQSLLPSGVSYSHLSNALWLSAFNKWSQNFQSTIPDKIIFQSSWDKPIYDFKLQNLLESSYSTKEKARLLAVSSKSANDWLYAIPIPSLGLKLDPMTLKISCAHLLGSTFCHPHTCICGENVDPLGYHGLACKMQLGRRSRHEEINDLIKRALVEAKIPAVKEPSNLSRTDGKRPDGLTLTSWKEGKCLIWDVTVADTVCQSYVYQCSKDPGAAANIRETKKTLKYNNLSNDYYFVPIGIETFGAWGPEGLKLVKMIGRKIMEATGEKRASAFLFQRISTAIQRGNSSCVLGTVPQSEGLEEIFEFVSNTTC